MFKEFNNYKILFILRLLKSILSTFVDSFLVLYFLQLSDSNILPLGIYKIVSVTTIYLTIFLLRNLCKSKYRINLLRIGIILDLVYFIFIIVLNEKVVDYIYILGIIYGLEEGFYYSVYNMFESNGVSNEQRAKFTGQYTTAKSILSILFPIIFGSLIATTGFIKSLIVVLIIVIIRIICSFIFKDESAFETRKTNIKKYIKLFKKDKKIMSVFKQRIFSGLTYSEGALSSIITIYIIRVFSDSFSLGIFTSIFSIVSCIIGILFAKIVKQKNYKNIMEITNILTIFGLVLMVVYCNFITIVVFKFLQTVSKEFTNLITDNNTANLSNIELIKKDYKIEYFLVTQETGLFVGRFISQFIFILMAFFNDYILAFIAIYTLFLILLTKNSIKLQELVEQE